MGIRLTTKTDKISMKKYYLNIIKDKDQRIAELEQDLEFTTKTANELIEIKHKLEQELAELKEKDNYHLRYELAGADETIANLKQQLAEKDNLIEFGKEEIRKRNKRIDEIVERDKKLFDDKNKEIEKLKQQYTILENENGKLTTELIMGKYKKAQKEVSFGKQLAIQELEKVKDYICDCTYIKEPDYTNVRRKIDNQIKELKGESK